MENITDFLWHVVLLITIISCGFYFVPLVLFIYCLFTLAVFSYHPYFVILRFLRSALSEFIFYQCLALNRGVCVFFVLYYSLLTPLSFSVTADTAVRLIYTERDLHTGYEGRQLVTENDKSDSAFSLTQHLFVLQLNETWSGVLFPLKANALTRACSVPGRDSLLCPLNTPRQVLRIPV